MLFIQFPQWVIDIWNAYSDAIIPIVISIIPVVLSWLVVRLKNYVKTSADKEAKLLEILAIISNKESSSEFLENQNAEIKTIKEAVTYLGSMLNLAYQNSNLDPEVKSNIESIVNKLRYGTEEDLIAQLEENNKTLLEQIENLKTQIAEKTIVAVTEEVRKRVRK